VIQVINWLAVLLASVVSMVVFVSYVKDDLADEYQQYTNQSKSRLASSQSSFLVSSRLVSAGRSK
jgi:hypothetical protein